MTFTVETKFVNALTDFDKAISIPLQVIGVYLASAIQTRAQGGMGAQGPMKPLGADSKATGRSLFWVPPEREHPGGEDPSGATGYLFKHDKGPRAGWAAYLNYGTYARLYGKGKPRNLTEKGDLWRSLAVKVTSPTRVKVTFFGSHPAHTGTKGQSNTSVAFLDSRKERTPLLMPNRAELEEVGRLLRDEVIAQAIRVGQIAGVGFDARKQTRSFVKRSSKLLGT